MPDFSIIKNKTLRKLVEDSAMLASLGEEKLKSYIQKIAHLPEEGTNKMISLLEAQVEDTLALAPEEQAKHYHKGAESIGQLMHEYKRKKREAGEAIEHKESKELQEKLLDDLKNT